MLIKNEEEVEYGLAGLGSRTARVCVGVALVCSDRFPASSPVAFSALASIWSAVLFILLCIQALRKYRVRSIHRVNQNRFFVGYRKHSIAIRTSKRPVAILSMIEPGNTSDIRVMLQLIEKLRQIEEVPTKYLADGL